MPLARKRLRSQCIMYLMALTHRCCVGFLQRHFVLHALTIDGALPQVTEVYSITCDSPIKQKRCRHNLGCCLASLISDFPQTGRKIDKATKTFLSKVLKGEEDSAKEMLLETNLKRRRKKK